MNRHTSWRTSSTENPAAASDEALAQLDRLAEVSLRIQTPEITFEFDGRGGVVHPRKRRVVGQPDPQLQAVAGDAGCHACHTQGSCSERCPKQIQPTAGIAGLKRLAARAAVRGEL